jgi:uncharacterized protein YcgI (DUF1989 family)
MKYVPENACPEDGKARAEIAPVICYDPVTLPKCDLAAYKQARKNVTLVETVLVPARDAACFEVPAGYFFRIVCRQGPQVGDLNLWNANDLNERFYSGKSRALHGTHLSTGDRMWSSFPAMRPLATITHDTLDWYGWDEFGGSVHDVIGTRCDPYTNKLLSGDDYHYCCHSNLMRALAKHKGLSLDEAETHVHDVLNVFMCTGFTLDTHQYFMKASPVRKGDYLEFLAETDLLGGLSACPGGDCSSVHSSNEARCHQLAVEIYKPAGLPAPGWTPAPVSGYCRGHGM